jgi:Superfamily II helicase and inactivated derivatives
VLEHAGLFVSKVLPWPEDGETAFINIHYRTTSLRPDGKKSVWGGRACANQDEFFNQLKWISTSPNILDIYVCMSSQSTAEMKTTKGGRSYVNAVRSSDCVVKLRSFYADVDVKEPPKGYLDTPAALLATQQFIQTLGLPLPTAMVASGSGGFHVHWAMEQGITREKWQPVADALARATSELGLLCDRGCTIDSARILRLPDTRNYKSDPPRPTSLMSLGDHVTLEQMLDCLGPYMGKPIAPAFDAAAPSRLTQIGNINEELTAGIEHKAPPIFIDEVAKQCAFIDEALQTGGINFNNDLWFDTINIAVFCEDGRTQAHRMSVAHPTYDVDVVNATYDRSMATKQKKDLGWPKCEYIGKKYPGCQKCPLYIDGKSPLNYGYASQQAQAALLVASNAPVASTLPSGYSRTPEGIVFVTQTGEDGNVVNIPVMPYAVHDWWLQDDPWVLHFTTKIGGHPLKIEAPLKGLGPKDGVSTVFSEQGLLFKEKAKPIVKEFMVSWIHRLQQSRDLIVSSTPFGWSEVNGKIEGFTYAGRVWGHAIDRPAAVPDVVLGRLYNTKGKIEPWLEAARIITDQRRPDLDAILAGAFGAPLMRFTGHEGAVMNAFSIETGIGKSTTMKTALAVWADPVKALQGLDDTANSVVGKMGLLKVMPLFWDEVKTEQQMKNLATLVFTITGGVEKSRMRADTTLRDRGTWQTLMITACNNSLIDAMERQTQGTNAGLVRLFEFAVVPPKAKGPLSQGEVSRKIADLRSNYGNAGLVYAQFIGANHERVAKRVGDLQDRIAKATDAGNEERFWVATMAVLIAGAMFANELKLTDIDVTAMTTFLISTMQGMRNEVKDSPTDMRNQVSVSNILAQFIKAMQARHTLVTNVIHTSAGKPAAGSVKVLSVDPNKLDGIHVQIGVDDKKMRISSTHFSKWMREQDYSRHAFTSAMKEEFGMRNVNGKLGGGTAFATPIEYLMEIDLSDPRLQRFMDL